ncbi:MAG: PQQ-binding-like beta-propeller repeat protein [Planctomycetaceae bacterium]|nr:PQQ-binding-like beta-propeller repeat protein [Planctomycetaceae bacterium]
MDWPTYQHDNRRSGKTHATLNAGSLAQAWTWQSPQPPQPAWSGPAKYDAYRIVKPLRSMRNYDPAFHMIVAGGSLFFGSSVDDSVHCLDAISGQEKWLFTTDAPVRIAPTFVDGKIYFGSDDGFAYCLAADDGSLVWKFRPSPDGRRFLNNGRLIGHWPVRTGVLVEDGTAYFAAGMLPWEDSYLCAVDAHSGKPQGRGRYVALHQGAPQSGRVEQTAGLTMEGAMLISADRLYIPQGRIPPLMFSRKDGRLLGSLTNGGGCFVLLTEDDQVLHGPGNNAGWITLSAGDSGQKLAAFDDGTAAVVHDGTVFVLTRSTLAAVDRASGAERWKQPCDYPYSLVLAGTTLFAGGADALAAFDADTGLQLWQSAVTGKVHGLALAAGMLYATTDAGAIYCFAPQGQAAANAWKPAPPAYVEGGPVEEITPPEAMPLAPYLQFTSRTAATVRWQTPDPVPTKFQYAHGQDQRAIEDPQPKVQHEVHLTDLRRDAIYDCTAWAGDQAVTFECDTYFNYEPCSVGVLPVQGQKQEHGRDAHATPEHGRDAHATPEHGRDAHATRQAAEGILKTAGVDRGICLMLGCGDGQLAYELARQSRLRVIAVDTDAAAVASARRMFQAAGVYGACVAVHHVRSYDAIPFVGSFANIIVASQPLSDPAAAEAMRLLCPGSGVLIRGGDTGCHGGRSPAAISPTVTTLPPIATAGVWTHQYGLADNTSYGGEALAGAGSTLDLAVQWVGEPGPRYQPDRNGRKPAPLAINGRLFGQGRRRIVALDSFNGTVLWSLEMPAFCRFNMPRDCGNWCADQSHLYAAVKGQCWKIDQRDGSVAKMFEVVSGSGDMAAGKRPPWHTGAAWDWGYVADGGANIIGSAVKAGSAFVAFVGHANWYDAKDGPATFKVCSENLFAMNKSTGGLAWKYAGGVVINSTICIADGRVYFVECRHPAVLASADRRVGMDELWQQQYLVALDAADGRLLWEQPLKTAPGVVVFYMAAAEGRLVINASDVRYNVYAFSAADGSALWQTSFEWMSDNHGGHMSHPAIVDGKVFVRPRVLDLATGALLEVRMPGGGCGTYIMTDRTAIFRSSHVTVWDFNNDQASFWYRLRPGCWISTVAACGMVLSPEAGGGCSCGSWLETSIAFAPSV